MKEKFPEVQEILKEVEYYKSLLKKRSLDQMVWIITSNQDLIKKAAKRYSLYDQFILLNIGQLLIKSQEFSKRNKS